MLFQIMFVTFQVEHYKKRVEEAETIERRIWLKEQLRGLQESKAVYYN